jgi:hypothetical protein
MRLFLDARCSTGLAAPVAATRNSSRRPARRFERLVAGVAGARVPAGSRSRAGPRSQSRVSRTGAAPASISGRIATRLALIRLLHVLATAAAAPRRASGFAASPRPSRHSHHSSQIPRGARSARRWGRVGASGVGIKEARVVRT